MHMENLSSSDPSHQTTHENNASKNSPDRPEDGSRWYFSRKEIEEYSPSKKDGIDLKKETYLRKSYCTYLQDLGMKLKVPQVTIATAIIFCHRFFLRQSHAKNDRRTIATVCMFLAGKVEETPRPLKDVILVSYEIINKKDPTAAQRIKQKEVYERQKELILLGERVVLATLAFDLNVHHPYKPLVEAIKKFKVAQNALAQVAWNFVNDGLRTSLCLQFKPHHIAAGAIFLAAKFLKVKLPSDGEKVWWQEFDVTPRQLEEVSNQMLELYEQNHLPPSGEAFGSVGGGASNRTTATKGPTNSEDRAVADNHSVGAGDRCEPSRVMQNPSIESTSTDIRSPSNHKTSSESKVRQEIEPSVIHDKGKAQNSNSMKHPPEGLVEQDQRSDAKTNESRDATMELKEKHSSRNIDFREGALGKSQEVIKKIDKDKLKAALEKRRKSIGNVPQKTELLDEDDLIERELEAGIEMAAGSDKNKREQRQSWIKSTNKQEHEDSHQEKHRGDDRDEHRQRMGQSPYDLDSTNMEEGEFATVEDVGYGHQSPKSNNRKRKAGSSQDKQLDGKQRRTGVAGSLHHKHVEDADSVGRLEHENHISENHV